MSSADGDIAGVNSEASTADIGKSDVTRSYLCVIKHRAIVYNLWAYRQLRVSREIT